jgi:hypothetical protein
MAAMGDTSEPDSPVRGVHLPLEEAAWLYQADQVYPEDLPMTAAQALTVGLDTPSLCELAGLPRHADPRDIRDTFEQALAELGIACPITAWPDGTRCAGWPRGSPPGRQLSPS